MRVPRGLVPLQQRDYSRYWSGFAVSNTGRWIELTGSLWLVYEITGSPLLLGFVGLARSIPSILLSPIAGVVADRLDQRWLLMGAQTAWAMVSLAVGVLVLAGGIEFWHIYIQVALQAAVRSFDVAGRQALFPRLVPRSYLPEAVTLSLAASQSSRFLGPALGGVAIGGLGEAAPFLIGALASGLVIISVALIRSPEPPAVSEPSTFVAELAAGFRQITSSPVLSGLLKLEFVFSLFQMNEVMITIIAREALDAGPEMLGALLAAPAIGSVLGLGSLMIFGQPGRAGRFVVFSTLAYAASVVAVGSAGAYPIVILSLAATGLLDALITVTRHSVMQLASPTAMRGRVMANMGTVTLGVGPLAQTQSGALAAALGTQVATLAAAVVLGLAAGFTARQNKALWGFAREDATSPQSGFP